MKQSSLRIKRRKGKVLNIIKNIFPYLLLLICILYTNNQRQQYENKISSLTEQVSQKESDIYSLKLTINSLRNVIIELNDQVDEVSQVNRSYVDELNMFRSREELYDKYEYAIICAGERTDLTYEEVQYAEELMLAEGLKPHLLIGSIMVESTANPVAVNKQSG